MYEKLQDDFAIQGTNGQLALPNKVFIVDANRKCYFGNHSVGYNMSFQEAQLMKPVRMLKNVKIENTLWTRFRRDTPSHTFYHEQPMTFHVHLPDMWYDFW